MFNAKEMIAKLCFADERFETTAAEFSTAERDPAAFERLITVAKQNDCKAITISALQDFLLTFRSQEVRVSLADMKDVFLALRSRERHPRGYFNQGRRWYSDNADLLNVIAPSAQYPYSQMNACRTAKFVKALAEKYRCQNRQELEAVAYQ